MTRHGSSRDLDERIQGAASELPRHSAPEQLWKSIEARLRRAQAAREEDAEAVKPAAAPGFRLMFAFRPRLVYAVYAAAIVLGVAAMAVLIVERPQPIPETAEAGHDRLVEEARDDIDHAMFFYERAIEKLTSAAEKNETSLDPGWVELQKERIAALKEAVRECKEELRGNKYNPEVQQYLLAAYMELQGALQEMATRSGESNNASSRRAL